MFLLAREREKGGEKERGRKGGRERESVCVFPIPLNQNNLPQEVEYRSSHANLPTFC